MEESIDSLTSTLSHLHVEASIEDEAVFPTVFDVSGNRELVTAENVEPLLSLCPNARDKITNVVLSTKSFMPDAARRVVDLLDTMPNLTAADLSDCISGIETSSVTIFHMNLSPYAHFYIIDNATGYGNYEYLLTGTV